MPGSGGSDQYEILPKSRPPIVGATSDSAVLLLAHMPAAVAMFDAEMRYMACTHRWLTDYWLADRQIIGRSHYEIFPEITDAWRAIHQRVLAGESLSNQMEPFFSTDESLDWMQWDMTPWRLSNGEIGGAILFTQMSQAMIQSGRIFDERPQDLTESELAESRARALQAELIRITRVWTVGTMADALTNELNQPLTAIANFVQTSEALIVEKADGALDLIREALESAGQEALRAGTIVNRLRKFSAGGALNFTIVSPRSMALETCALGAIVARSRNIACEVAIAPDIPLVKVDRVHIQKVLFNLINNAIDAINGTGIIVIDAHAAHGMVCVTVRDTGSGIAEGQELSLFEPFVSGRATGMGLGLAICRTIVEAHGGRLWYEEAAMGGAAFHFTLPVAELDDGGQGAGSHCR
jgi:signal transduction histidine kinase